MASEEKFNCIFCKDVFDSKEELQVHFRKHGDPKFVRKNRYEPLVSKENDKDQSEMVSCDVCSQMFPTISKAITHKHKVHPDHDVKYFCPWCGKLFTMKHPYNTHLQSTHENEEQIGDKTFHCDCCDVDFFLSTAMMYHNKFFHRQHTDIPDIGSSKKLKLYHNQEVIPVYYCAFCGEEYENKVNLYKHVTDDHSDENQCPEEVLRCPLCEAIFYHLDAYEIHLSFHTTEDLYSCKNDLIGEVVDFSLETIPPMIEKVEREGFDTEGQLEDIDTEAVNAVGIENFLELAMGQAEDSNSGKPKKKKHKKSKKAAITLDEFLSMNQDVFGEGLDFQGVEEVPTRVVAKQFKGKKKAINPTTSAELEKLKSKGIVVMKVGASKPLKSKKVVNKAPPSRELKTSSELLTKLINQSNKEIKIVKKSVTNAIKKDSEVDMKDIAKKNISAHGEPLDQKNIDNETEITKKDSTEKKIVDGIGSTTPKLYDLITKATSSIPSPKIEECSSTTNLENMEPNAIVDKTGTMLNNEDDSNDETNITSTNIANINSDTGENIEINNAPKVCERDDNIETSFSDNNLGKDESDQHEFDPDVVDKDKIAESNDLQSSNKDKNSVQLDIKPLASSLSTLKHLSHLTVKPVIQNKNTVSKPMSDEIPESKTIKSHLENDEPGLSSKQSETISKVLKTVVDRDPTSDALKILGNNITVKSLTAIKKSFAESGSDDDIDTDVLEKPTNTLKLKDVSGNKNLTIKKVKTDKFEPAPTFNKIADTSITPIKNPQITNTCESELKSINTNVDNLQNSAIKTNTDVLKRLPNVTTKNFTMKSNQPQFIKQTNIGIKATQTKHKEQEVIEISDIDDSDDERDDNFKLPESENDTMTDPLQKLSKHITIKSLNQSPNTMQKNVKPDDFDDGYEPDGNFNDNAPITTKTCGQKISNKNFALKNALKNLGMNITVKSRNSSPSQSVRSQDHNSRDSYSGANDDDDDDRCDSDSEVGKFKITEIHNENSRHDENFDNSDSNQEGLGNGPIIESPHDSCSEQDERDESDFDFESQIKVSTVHKSNQEVSTNKNTMFLNNLSKSITIKSLNSKPGDKQEQSKPNQSQEDIEVTKNQTTQPHIKLPKQTTKDRLSETTPSNKNIRDVGKVSNQSSNESLNQKVSVNKEVTVKTFQTKTVIQEITTTVTKTIKTVNQTVKQETKDSSQMNIPIMPQKVIGMRPSISKNLQGVAIRHAAPLNVKTSNAVAQIRPSGNVVRPMKQIVPMRCTRPNAPRMLIAKPNIPKSACGGVSKHVIGKPLKFSPNAMMSTPAKRPNTENANGPFSCFKKPKESLIPVSEVPSYSGEGSAQVNAASHTSTSNYTATSKVIKGNYVMTATQMKSEVTSMQQLSKFNTNDVKIKNAQTKQTQVQEKSESSAMKQTTLETIERLQKQGLLIKKPRLEENENSDSDHDNVGYNSTDEQYE